MTTTSEHNKKGYTHIAIQFTRDEFRFYANDCVLLKSCCVRTSKTSTKKKNMKKAEQTTVSIKWYTRLRLVFDRHIHETSHYVFVRRTTHNLAIEISTRIDFCFSSESCNRYIPCESTRSPKIRYIYFRKRKIIPIHSVCLDFASLLFLLCAQISLLSIFVLAENGQKRAKERDRLHSTTSFIEECLHYGRNVTRCINGSYIRLCLWLKAVNTFYAYEAKLLHTRNDALSTTESVVQIDILCIDTTYSNHLILFSFGLKY